jgi:hypothetical protein
MQVVSGAVNVLAGKNLEVYAPNNTHNLTLKHDGSYAVLNTPADGAPIQFLLGGSEKARVDAGGLVFYNGNRIALLNATNSVNVELASSEQPTNMIIKTRGAVQHWADAALARGGIYIQTTDPATTGSPGEMVLVYE